MDFCSLKPEESRSIRLSSKILDGVLEVEADRRVVERVSGRSKILRPLSVQKESA
jgi:hypothetical protein